MVLTEADDGRTIETGVGSDVTLRLKENPTTGYRWVVQSAGGLAPAGDTFESAAGGVGGAGSRVLTFRVSDPGSHELRLANYRSWEPQTPAAQFHVRIIAR